jgi:predicted small metal-binding protein
VANVDDVCVAGVTSAAQIANLISQLLQVPISSLKDGRPYLNVDDRTQVTMYPDSDDPGRWIAEVYHAGADSDQELLARRIYDHLVEHTNWDLTLDSDNADNIIASRINSHTR